MNTTMKTIVRQFLAEMLGTFLLVLLGDGAIAQKTMFAGDFLNVAFGYGLALTMGILVSGNVSGGHFNPAVTLAMACLKKCTWLQLPVYWVAQYLGAFLGAAVLFGVYNDGIVALPGGKSAGTAGIFASYPNGVATDLTLSVDQILGTAILLIIILAVTDENNMKVASGLVPLLIGLGLTSIHISLAFNAGCAINPARDFSPRLLTLIAGWSADDTFSRDNYFFWIPLVLPHVGGVIGAMTYYWLIEKHHPKL